MKKIRTFLADDHAILREGLKLILSSVPELEIVGEAGDGGLALEQIEALKPDMVILDISMPTITGIEITRKLRKYYPEMRIIILSRHDNEEYVDQLLKHGIHGYVLKDDAGNDLIRAVDAVLKQETYLSPRITKRLMTELGSEKKRKMDSSFQVLSNREREILKLIAEGKTNEEIGQKLLIAAQTVKVHRANIMKKLGLHKTAELVKYAIKEGIIES